MEKILIDDIEYFYDLESNQIIEIPMNKPIISNKSEKKIFLSDNFDENKDTWYPSKPDINLWESFLNRNLTIEEKEIMLEVIVEIDLNNQIQLLKKNILEQNCFIPKLTNNNGNCLFESLSVLGLGENELGIEQSEMIRNNLSSVLLYIRNCTDFFPNISLSPEEIFNNSNDIEFIKFKNQEVWEYNYDMMICDLRTNKSWTRLPTELILMSISRIYQVKIFIHHNKTKYTNIINVWENSLLDTSLDIIHLGLINEEHYIPILEIPKELFSDPDILKQISNINLKYSSAKTIYNKWVEIISLSIFDSNSNILIQNNQNSSTSKWGLNETDFNENINLEDFEFIN